MLTPPLPGGLKNDLGLGHDNDQKGQRDVAVAENPQGNGSPRLEVP